MDFTTGVGIPASTVIFRRFRQFDVIEVAAVTGPDGSYALALPLLGEYTVLVDDVRRGGSRVHVFDYRGDFFVNTGQCIGAYGMVMDVHALRPVAGAIVRRSNREAITGSDGWYRIDAGCPADRPPGCPSGPLGGMSVYHPDYGTRVMFASDCGGASRGDILIERQR